MIPLDRMLNITKLIKDKSEYETANIFGLIAYTERNPYVAKVIKDVEFWNSLSVRSKGWIVYAVKPESSYAESRHSTYLYSSLGVSERELPQLILLAIGPEKTIMQKNYAIEGNDEVSTYESMEKIIDSVSNSVDKIFPRYKNSINVFREAVAGVDFEFALNRWKKAAFGLVELLKRLK